ncbi:MAG: DUF3179 domain-containing protein [Rugosibacter sp.]|nr:MAG: DUF3179 domain-containing protein [Rugosibacter sp.]TBR11762.1 MAG: DUF3179 domain-containing protein [Rugosibacter sp.]
MKYHFLLAAIATLSISQFASADVVNGFDLNGASIPDKETLEGGPPKDGIPSINQPKFLPAGKANLKADDRVLGVVYNGMAKAYPVQILNWHEIVNDKFDTENIVVTYCPLCRSGVVFRATVKGKPATFGVSGLLYNSNVLLYDRETESLWSQIGHQAVTGTLKGEKLEPIPVSNTTWKWWRAKHPDTLVLSEDTGYLRDYEKDPYGGYAESPVTYFPFNPIAPTSYEYKDVVIGIEISGHYKAYPLVELQQGASTIRDVVAGHSLNVQFDRKSQTVVVNDAHGKEVTSLLTYWFAWYAFHPDTEVYSAKTGSNSKNKKSPGS